MTSARLRFLRRMTALSRIVSRRPRTRPCCLVNANFRLLWAARWAPLCLFFDPISDPASKARGTHARHTSTFFGNGIASAPGVPGDHFRRLHDRMVCTLVEFVRSARVLVKGGHTGTCKDTFSKCLKVGDATDEEDQRLIQGLNPDMVIDARGRINGGTFPDIPWTIA